MQGPLIPFSFPRIDPHDSHLTSPLPNSPLLPLPNYPTKPKPPKMDTQHPNLSSIQTERIYLEPLSLTHLSDFHELWTSEEAVKWSTRLVMKSVEESKEFMKKILPNEENPDIDKFAILLKDVEETRKLGVAVKNEKGEPKCIGITGTNRPSPQGLETGYCLNASYWNHGFATEAFSLFLGYYWTLPQRKDVKWLVAKTDPENKASERVLQKCGGKRGDGVVKLKPAWKNEGWGEVEREVVCWRFDRPGEESLFC
ncbi:acyl-CoA N-acyltransferase [Mollisia scopiformis]|uniref:Acyl-CoA N-acyltransferase n=1 Tax=Mollisia scopiformis TaxID=149040 RepID=A0A194XT86_MOLSC|nr:acyl-CoA N-acyltransferase [Mollisia scopiformis]KUJ23418.1 acyl-CoA N-acyltransferase [Mollisia scopiformis]